MLTQGAQAAAGADRADATQGDPSNALGEDPLDDPPEEQSVAQTDDPPTGPRALQSVDPPSDLSDDPPAQSDNLPRDPPANSPKVLLSKALALVDQLLAANAENEPNTIIDKLISLIGLERASMDQLGGVLQQQAKHRLRQYVDLLLMVLRDPQIENAYQLRDVDGQDGDRDLPALPTALADLSQSTSLSPLAQSLVALRGSLAESAGAAAPSSAQEVVQRHHREALQPIMDQYNFYQTYLASNQPISWAERSYAMTIAGMLRDRALALMEASSDGFGLTQPFLPDGTPNPWYTTYQELSANRDQD